MATTITRASSVFNTSTVGLALTTADTLTLDPGAIVQSTLNDGITLGGTGQIYTVAMNGTAASYNTTTTANGLYVSNSGNIAHITVGQTGHISGPIAILNLGSGNLDNSGTIDGNSTAGGAVQIQGASAYSVVNQALGRISNGISAGDAVVLTGTGAHTVTNAGIISAGTGGYAFKSTDTAAIDTVTNSGRMIGKVDLGGGADVFHNETGIVTGTVTLGDGDDTYYGSSTVVATGVGTGTYADDTVYGGLGNDTIFGYAGNDTIYGGAGVNHLYGGLGDDAYYVDNSTDIVSEAFRVFYFAAECMLDLYLGISVI